ncbi:MAG: HAD-IB family hydrolase [Nitrospirae bacterium]|nr:MAG: HAD-IB family hydrolase [Nitrospirota bacterium]
MTSVVTIETAKRQNPSWTEPWVGAFFDVDNTLVPGFSMEIWFVRHLVRLGVIGVRELSRSFWFLLQRIPPLSLAPLRSHKLYLFGQDPDVIESIARTFVLAHARHKISARAEAQLERHRRAGHRIALISGSPEFLVKPLAELLNVSLVYAARLETNDRGYTGRVFAPLPYGHGKRLLVERLAKRYRLDLTRSYAYGDSPGDLQALQAVGYPHVVNPIRGMARIARKRGWPITQWA